MTCRRGQVTIGQTAAAALYVGLATGLAPAESAELARATSAALGIQEMYNALFYGTFVPKMVWEAVLCRCLPELGLTKWFYHGKCLATYRHWMSTFERWLRTRTAQPHANANAESDDAVTFLAGDALSFADVCLYDCVQAVEEVGYFTPDDRTTLYPKLSALVALVAQLPSIAEYVAKRPPRFE